MFGLIVKGLTIAGTYAGVVAGADVVAKAANKLAEGSRYEGHVAGFGDSIVSVLDPLDITGYRAGKERKREEELSKAKSASEREKLMRKHADQDRKRAEKAVKEAQAKVAEARKLAASSEAKAVRLDAQNRKAEAQRARENALAQQRLATLAERVASKAQATQDPAKAESVALASIDLAKQAMQPAANAVEAINKEFTAQGKSIAAALVDAVRRDDEPDYDSLVSEITGDESGTEGPDHATAGAEDGSCCLACHLGGGSCGGASKPVTSGSFLDVGEGDAGILEVDTESDGEGLLEQIMISGHDEWADRYLAARAFSELEESEPKREPIICVDGRCYLAGRAA